MKRLVLLSVMILLFLAGCMQTTTVSVAYSPHSGHGPTTVTIELGDLGSGWSYTIEWDGGSRTQGLTTFHQVVYPPATLSVFGVHNDGRTTSVTTLEITLDNDPPVGYDPFGPKNNFLVPAQMYIVDCNYREAADGFEWSPATKMGFLDPEGDPWKIVAVECWYEIEDGARIDDPVFTPPLSPGEVEYHVGTDMVPVHGYRIDNAFIIFPAIAHWAHDGNDVPIPPIPLNGYPPPCDQYALTGGYIPPGTIYHIDITVEDWYGDTTVLNVEKPLSGRAECTWL